VVVVVVNFGTNGTTENKSTTRLQFQSHVKWPGIKPVLDMGDFS
jgi:hypothetical protein